MSSLKLPGGAQNRIIERVESVGVDVAVGAGVFVGSGVSDGATATAVFAACFWASAVRVARTWLAIVAAMLFSSLVRDVCPQAIRSKTITPRATIIG